MRGIDNVCNFLGPPYTVKMLDGEAVIYRSINDCFELEVSGVKSVASTCVLYIWSRKPHQELIGIYKGIKGADNLKDLLGYYSAKLQNLPGKIQVEREAITE